MGAVMHTALWVIFTNLSVSLHHTPGRVRLGRNEGKFKGVYGLHHRKNKICDQQQEKYRDISARREVRVD